MKKGYNLVVVLGPTASGKTRIGVAIARRLGGEIISADSRQVYRGMDLGTGKDLDCYIEGGEPVPYHLIDILEPSEEFSVFAFQKYFSCLFSEITSRGRMPVLVGGTGLYLEAVLRQYRMPAVPRNEELRLAMAGEDMTALQRRFLSAGLSVHNSTDLLDRERLIRAIEIRTFRHDHPDEDGKRLDLVPLILGIHLERGELTRRIVARLDARMEAGMCEEVQRLHDSGISWEKIDSFGLEYRHCARYLQGKLDRQTLVQLLAIRIRQYAKRQSTWFRRMERNGMVIHWVDGADPQTALDRIVGLTT